MIDGEDAVYVKNLEALVQSRTHQMVATVEYAEKLEGVLRQIQTLGTVEEIRHVVQATFSVKRTCF